jgi:hypothetical protein
MLLQKPPFLRIMKLVSYIHKCTNAYVSNPYFMATLSNNKTILKIKTKFLQLIIWKIQESIWRVKIHHLPHRKHIAFPLKNHYVKAVRRKVSRWLWNSYGKHNTAWTKCWVFKYFFFSSGPRAYAPDARQPAGLLCYPSVSDVPTFAASPSPCPCYPRDP